MEVDNQLKNNDILKSSFHKNEDKERPKKSVKFVAQERENIEQGGEAKQSSLGKHLHTQDEELPLENGWSFWEDHCHTHHGEMATTAQYEASLKKVSSFSTVQGFWKEFNKLPHLISVPNNSCYHLMKEGSGSTGSLLYVL
ncbi:hypothetical protein DFA_07528 [Cavenderia fasciculata]|uniref:Uncharacterized protein n=1 Tax=Cavenderia fasciculata TaxID=261658 RepID=F4PWP0_CACFS|nr:uncharacterized protein DFA_07528 [Cavenderia fasciculata]EGG20404.1 hypothetical protein DFA_07528 [Cavenderia fasciculata]|eukprot:XP_004367387.1 hypothetical protein DFA_07528 [Cavenderia fasciculata]